MSAVILPAVISPPLLTLRPGLLTARGLPADCVKACFALSAAFNLERKNCGPVRSQVVDQLLQKDDDGSSGTPLNYAKGNKVPFYIAWGSKDTPELMIENEKMVDLLGAETCAIATDVFEGNSHFDTNIGCADPDGPWVRTVRKWMTALPIKEKT